MLRAGPVRQSPPPRISPRRIRPSQSTNSRREGSPFSSSFRLGPLLISAFLCLAGVGVYMWPRVQVVRLAYRMQTAEQHLKELLQEQDQLRLELAALKDPQRIYYVATEQLGMSFPRQDQVFIVTRDLQSR
jgi:cell division protein FtsL